MVRGHENYIPMNREIFESMVINAQYVNGCLNSPDKEAKVIYFSCV